MILDDILEMLKQKSDNKAYTVNSESYSYKQLYKFVCNIYDFLLKENKEKRPVIVYGHKEIYMKATFIACSLAGMTYVPIDDSTPEERVKEITKQVNPSLIIGKNITKEKIYKIMNEENYNEINDIYLKPNDIYYIIFTSGSTGIPKGVKVTYKNLDSCINWLTSVIKINKGVIINQANFSFDLSIADLYLSLETQSEHFIINNKVFDFNNIFEQLGKSNANLMVATPSFIDLLLLDKSFRKELMPNLQTILFCGEKLLKSTINKLYERFENIKIINSYGPTECTFAVTSIEINKEMENYNDIPVGISKKDVKIYIVDENKNYMKDEEIGEILITGESVADGYLENIKNNSFIKYNGVKAYLTGDLGFMKNGILYYKERKDKQIKFKGYRIELTDIENNLQKLDYIDKVVAIAKKNKYNKVINIIAFVILKESINKSELEIKQDLQTRIPEYMCPKIKIVSRFPLNRNGKRDEKKLLEGF